MGSTVRRRFLSPLAGLVLLFGACSETMIDLSTDASVDGGAGSPQAPGSGGAAPTPPEELPAGGAAFGGASSCSPAVKFRASADGRCVARGASITIVTDAGFDVSLTDCADEDTNLWFLYLSGGTYEVRNTATNYNLDVLLASTDDGTRIVLYQPHQLFNQRFFFRPRSESRFEIAPRHSESQCLSVRGSHLELWPCDSSAPDQLFELAACNDP